jgi:DoxX-like family
MSSTIDVLKQGGSVALAAVVLFILTAVAFAGSASLKLRTLRGEPDANTKEFLQRLRISMRLFQAAGALELLAAIGLLAGLAFPPLGIAAAAGLVVLMLGALGFHLRAGDPPAALLTPAISLVLSAATVAVSLAAL